MENNHRAMFASADGTQSKREITARAISIKDFALWAILLDLPLTSKLNQNRTVITNHARGVYIIKT